MTPIGGPESSVEREWDHLDSERSKGEERPRVRLARLSDFTAREAKGREGEIGIGPACCAGMRRRKGKQAAEGAGGLGQN